MHRRLGRVRIFAALLGLGVAARAPTEGLAAPPQAPANQSPPDGLSPPTLLTPLRFDYPAEWLRAEPRPRGRVTVRFVVDTSGAPTDLEVVASDVEGSPEAITPRVLETIASLRYEPARYQGQVVETILALEVVIEPPAREDPTAASAEPTDPFSGDADEPTDGAPRDVGPGGDATLRGTLLRAGDRVPLAQILVLVVPAADEAAVGPVRKRDYGDESEASSWSVRVQTDASGRFRVPRLPPIKVRMIVLAEGLERSEWIVDLQKPGPARKYFVEPDRSQRFRTSVIERKEPDSITRSISAEEINSLPGTQGDALKAIQNFPGVARPPFGAGLLVIRGAAPSDSRTILAHHEIPQLFHFGALVSIFNSDAITQIDFIPGNFDARYGDAIGGIVNVSVRKGRRDGHHGYVDADLFDAGGMAEGRLGRGSYLLSVRRSWVDAVLRAAIPGDANLDFRLAPRYWDYQALFDVPVSGGNLSLRWFGSDDRFALIAGDDSGTGNSGDGFSTTIGFHRVDLAYEAALGPWKVLITPSFRHEYFSGAASDLFSFRTLRNEFSGRVELTRRFSSRFSLRVGGEIQTGPYNITAISPAVPMSGVGFDDTPQRANVTGHYAMPAVYTTGTIAAGERLTLIPSLRVTSRLLVYGRPDAEPRMRAHIKLADATSLKLGLGLVAQIPDVFEFNSVWGNPRIRLERGVHSSFGAEHEFSSIDLTVEGTVFHKYLWDLALPSMALLRSPGGFLPERFANSGDGQVGGFELLVRRQFAHKLFGWLSYTYSRAFYRERPDGPLVPFVFDQPHILTAILMYRLPHHWQVGGRFRLVSGNPTTPLNDCVSDLSDGECIDLPGVSNSARIPAFHQLDLRVDKTWIRRRAEIVAYLDVQNAYGRRNVEGTIYSWDRHASIPLSGLPILPSIGLKIGW